MMVGFQTVLINLLYFSFATIYFFRVIYWVIKRGGKRNLIGFCKLICNFRQKIFIRKWFFLENFITNNEVAKKKRVQRSSFLENIANWILKFVK